MAQLDRLNSRRAQLRATNSERMMAFIRRLDEQLYTPSQEEPAANRSTRPPTAAISDADEPGLRELLPRRRDPTAGGPYGDAILERVARNYGV